MAALNALDKGEDGRIFIGGILKGIEVHPEYPFNKVWKSLSTPNSFLFLRKVQVPLIRISQGF